MMSYYIEPEVAGGFGADVALDTSTHPSVVEYLHYEFDGWLGDEILEAFPSYIVTRKLASIIESSGLTGYSFDFVRITKSLTFNELYPGRDLPEFVWLKISGEAGINDFAYAEDYRLMVSEKALKALQLGVLNEAIVEPAL